MHSELDGLRLRLHKAHSSFSDAVDDYRRLFQENGTKPLDLENGFLRIACALKGEANRGINYDAELLAEDFGLTLAEMAYLDEDDSYLSSLAEEAGDEIAMFQMGIVHTAKAGGLYIEDPSYDSPYFTLYDDYFDGGGPGPHITFDEKGRVVRSSKMDDLESTGMLQDEANRLGPITSLHIEPSIMEGALAEIETTYTRHAMKYMNEEEERMFGDEGLYDIEPDEDDLKEIFDLVPPELEEKQIKAEEDAHKKELIDKITEMTIDTDLEDDMVWDFA